MIEDLLKQNTECVEILTGYDNIVLELKKKLRIIPHYFVHFSRHDQSHSEQIIQYIERLLGVENVKKLSASDQLKDIGVRYCEIFVNELIRIGEFG